MVAGQEKLIAFCHCQRTSPTGIPAVASLQTVQNSRIKHLFQWCQKFLDLKRRQSIVQAVFLIRKIYTYNLCLGQMWTRRKSEWHDQWTPFSPSKKSKALHGICLCSDSLDVTKLCDPMHIYSEVSLIVGKAEYYYYLLNLLIAQSLLVQGSEWGTKQYETM